MARLGLQEVSFARSSLLISLCQLLGLLLYPLPPERLNLGIINVGELAHVQLESCSVGQPWVARVDLVEPARDCSRGQVDPDPVAKQVLRHVKAKTLGMRVLGNVLPIEFIVERHADVDSLCASFRYGRTVDGVALLK